PGKRLDGFWVALANVKATAFFLIEKIVGEGGSLIGPLAMWPHFSRPMEAGHFEIGFPVIIPPRIRRGGFVQQIVGGRFKSVHARAPFNGQIWPSVLI